MKAVKPKYATLTLLDAASFRAGDKVQLATLNGSTRYRIISIDYEKHIVEIAPALTPGQRMLIGVGAMAMLVWTARLGIDLWHLWSVP